MASFRSQIDALIGCFGFCGCSSEMQSWRKNWLNACSTSFILESFTLCAYKSLRALRSFSALKSSKLPGSLLGTKPGKKSLGPIRQFKATKLASLWLSSPGFSTQNSIAQPFGEQVSRSLFASSCLAVPWSIWTELGMLLLKIGSTANPIPKRLQSLNFGASGTIASLGSCCWSFGSLTISRNSTTSYTSGSAMFVLK